MGGTDGSKELQRPVEHCVKSSPDLERGKERSADRQPVSLGPLPCSGMGSGFLPQRPSTPGLTGVFAAPCHVPPLHGLLYGVVAVEQWLVTKHHHASLSLCSSGQTEKIQ